MADLGFITANSGTAAFDQQQNQTRANALQDLSIQSQQRSIAGQDAMDAAVRDAYGPGGQGGGQPAPQPTPAPTAAPSSSNSPGPGSTNPGLAAVQAPPSAGAPPPSSGGGAVGASGAASPAAAQPAGNGPSPGPAGAGGAYPQGAGSAYPQTNYAPLISSLSKINAPGTGQTTLDLMQRDTLQKQGAVKRQEDMEKAAVTALAAGEMETFQYFAQKAGMQVPPEVLANVQQRQLFARGSLVAERVYKEDPQHAAAFIQAYMASGGDIPSAFQQAGPPRLKPDLSVDTVVQEGKNVLAIIDKHSGAVSIPTGPGGKPFEKGYPPAYGAPVATTNPDGTTSWALPQTRGTGAGTLSTTTAPAAAKPAAPAFGAPVVTTGEDGKPVYAMPQTRGTGAGTITSTSTTAVPKGSGPGSQVFEAKRAAWLSVNPNDAQGALDYASNKKTMSDVDLRKAAESMVQRQHQNDVRPAPPDQLTRERTQIFNYLKSGDSAAPAVAAPVAPASAAPLPAPAAGGPAAPAPPAAPAGPAPTGRYNPATGKIE